MLTIFRRPEVKKTANDSKISADGTVVEQNRIDNSQFTDGDLDIWADIFVTEYKKIIESGLLCSGKVRISKKIALQMRGDEIIANMNLMTLGEDRYNLQVWVDVELDEDMVIIE